MDDQAHVRLVHAHAEGVGRGDHPHAAGEEGLLHRALVRWQHATVEIAAGQIGIGEETRDFFHRLLACAENDCAALFTQCVLQQAQHLRVLGCRWRRAHFIVKILTAYAALESVEHNAQALLEVLADVVHHIRLGGRREAEHRRRLVLLARADESRDV